ncbi:restriction endonuclease subunit S [Emticicia fluvialis]|uniref:restriction endonuclease subunit S n=1 Tax=Emticicia fluvialis TaxID=2974474 RepID=UPI002165F7E8|nr:restriction endonuclease subunit S [Emticicia fluvialis]
MIDRNKIPDHWEVKELGEVCKLKNGFAFKSDNYQDNGVPIIRISDINGGLVSSQKAVRVEAGDEYENYTIQNNDILVAMSGATTGKFGIYRSSEKAYQNQRVGKFLILDNENLDNNFLFYLINSLKKNIEKDAYGGAQPNISSSKIEQMEIVLPPFAEQQAIVAKIEELLSDLENGKQQLLTAQAQLKVYRQSLLKWAFEGKLTNKDVKEGELPEGWKWVNLEEIAVKITDGEHITPKRTPEGYYLLSARNIQNGYLSLDDVDFVPLNEYERILKRCNPEYGDILISCSGSIGRVCRVPKDIKFVLVRSVALIKIDWEKYSSKFYEYLFQSPFLQKQIEESKKATAQANLFLGPIKKLKVLVCSKDKQEYIVSELESKLTVCNKLEETISQSLLQAETLKQSILKMAFEGKLVTSQEVESNIIKPVLINTSKVINGISVTDLHAGIIAMVIDAHEKTPQHFAKLNHVKGEKIAHLVEYKLGISLGRTPVKDAAGPDDYSHLKAIEHRADKANWFGVKKLDIGYTYFSKPGAAKLIKKVKENVSKDELTDINNLIATFLPFTMEQAEIVATLFAGWNNLLLEGKLPTDEEIVYESRENWSERKLKIERERFFKALQWMKEHNYIPEGRGKMVLKSEKVTAKKKTSKKNINKGA